jgi:LacI family transcriptional regulator
MSSMNRPAPERPARRVTIVDVAAHAGVSTAAASKVLRNAYGVSPQMREKVEAAIKELGYRPLASARAMRGKTFTIGVLVSDVQNPFFGLLIDGITDEVERSGYELMVGPAGATAASQSRMIEAMVDRQMDGLILISPVLDASSLADVARRIPTVVVGRHGPADEYDTVAGDDLAGAALIVEHLVSLGHRDIAYLTHADPDGSDPRFPQQVRERGYREAMERLGLADRIDVVPARWTAQGGRSAARDLLARDALPTALFAGADVAALGVLTELWEHEREVPGEISIVGYDDTPTAALAPISLTSADQAGFDMGATAARLLLDRFTGRTDARHVLTTPRLVARRTSAAPRA